MTQLSTHYYLQSITRLTQAVCPTQPNWLPNVLSPDSLPNSDNTHWDYSAERRCRK